MEERERQANMPRGALPRDYEHVESVIWGLAIFLSLVFAFGQIFTVLAAAPAVVAFYAEAGDVPGIVSLASSLGPLGMALLLVILDLLILALFLWLAKRYWIGLAFIPPVLYLGIGAVILWMLLAQAFTTAVLG